MSPGTAGYGVACFVYAALGVASLTRWRRGLAGLWVVPALLVSAAWAGVIAFADAGSSTLEFILNVARAALWLLVIANLAGRSTERWRAGVRLVLLVAPLAVLLAGALSQILPALGVAAPSGARIAADGGVLLAVIGLLLTERAHRSAAPAERWAQMPLLVGIASFFVFDVVLAASPFVPADVESVLRAARGDANVVAALVLAVGLKRLIRHRPAVQMHRGVVFYIVALVVIGSYAAAAAFAAAYARAAGGEWGKWVEILGLVGALVALSAYLFSPPARAWTRVVLTKAFAPYRYDYRAEWLRLTDALSAGEGPAPLADRAVQAVIQIVHGPEGGLWARDDDGRFAPVAGTLATLPGNTAEASDPWVRFIEANEWVLDLSAAPPAQAPDLVLPAWLTADRRAWLVVPLVRGNALEGFVLSARAPGPAVAMSWEDLDVLRTTGRHVAAFLALDRVAQRLAQSQQFEAYNRFVAFTMHDLKNIAAQLALVVENARAHRRNPEFIDDMVVTIDNASNRMLRLLEQLRQGEEASVRRRVDVVDTCRLVAARCSRQSPAPRLVAPPGALEVVLDPDRLAHVLEHVIRNAQQATAPTGSVTIRISRTQSTVRIEVADTGAGMSPEFIRDRLFRPFHSTKGTLGMGIGAYQTREFVRGAGGSLEVESTLGKGTNFRIELPLSPAGAGRLAESAVG